MIFILTIKTLKRQVLTYKVKEYKIQDGQVIFTDNRNGLEKRFSIDRVDIEEVRE